ncbi:ParA family protein [Streptomyces sp. NPDC054838]
MNLDTLPRQKLKEIYGQTLSADQIRAWIDENGCLVIGVGMLKGGAGKTTSVIYLALYLAIILGLKVAVIDTDDNSQSVDKWYGVRERRNEDVPFDLVVFDPKDEEGPGLDDMITDLITQGYQAVLVDIGGSGKEMFWPVGSMAHLMLVTLKPAGIESDRVSATVRQAVKGAKVNPRSMPVFVTLVDCDRRTSLPEEQSAAISAMLSLLPQVEESVAQVIQISEAFQISGATHYPRLWQDTPKRAQLDEFGRLFRHMMFTLVNGAPVGVDA